MRYREVMIEDDKTLGDSGVEITDINLRDPITELILKLTVQNTSGVSADVPPEIAFTKIELTDGGATYMTMTGKEAVAAACYDKGFWPPHWYCEYGSVDQNLSIPLQFGRYVGDPMFAFDPTALRNPQLKVTYAKDDDHESGYVRMGILAKVMEDAPSPGRILLYKQIEEFTSDTEGIHTVDLPTDYPIRRILTRAFVSAGLPSNILTHHKLDCDVGKLIVFDHDAAEWEDICRAAFGPFEVRKYECPVAAGGYKECWMAGRTVALPAIEEAGLFTQAWASGGTNYQIRAYSAIASAYRDANVQVIITGDFPHCTYCYQFGLPMEEGTWFPAPDYGDIDLKLTQGAAASCSVVVQQPRSLP